MWDEMSITKDLRCDTRIHKWKAIVDYGNELVDTEKKALSDHVLVFVFRPFLSSSIQPFAWFGTSGGAKGNVLAQLMITAISCLHSNGAIVSSCVCDGYSTNKSTMNQFGIRGKKESPYAITHPVDEKREVKFMIDAPHLAKSTRNHVFNNKNKRVMVKE